MSAKDGRHCKTRGYTRNSRRVNSKHIAGKSLASQRGVRRYTRSHKTSKV